MRILFDQGTPVPLRQHLSGHDVTTAFELGWSSIANGELLARAEVEGFDVLITTDRTCVTSKTCPAAELRFWC